MFLEFEKPIFRLQNQIDDLSRYAREEKIDCSEEIKKLKERLESLRRDIYHSLDPWQRTQIARCQERPYFLDYAEKVFSDFTEFHGDRSSRDDQSLIGGPAFFKGETVMLIGHQKGRETKENLRRNFGMPNPEGYRKAARLMKLAEKFKIPVITFIDTPGAYPGIAAEEHGQGQIIADNLRLMAGLETPILTVIIGEGGSGGALAIGMGNYVLMLENSIYSVISPEGCASILFKDVSRARDAAGMLKLTAKDLIKLNIIDEIIPEPLGGAHRDPDAMAERMSNIILKYLGIMKKMTASQVLDARHKRFRDMGIFLESRAKTTVSKKNHKQEVKQEEAE